MPGNVGGAQWWEQYMAHQSPILGARSHVAATPSDTVDIVGPNGAAVCRAVMALAAGNIALVLADDDTASPITVPFATGEIKALQSRRIMNTNTTVAAANIICLF